MIVTYHWYNVVASYDKYRKKTLSLHWQAKQMQPKT